MHVIACVFTVLLCRTDTTIDLIKYRWLGFRLMTGKLDWLLTKECKVCVRGGRKKCHLLFSAAANCPSVAEFLRLPFNIFRSQCCASKFLSRPFCSAVRFLELISCWA